MIDNILYERDNTFYGRFKNIALGFIIICGWIMIIIPILNYVSPPEPPDPFVTHVTHSFLYILFFTCISAPLWEEVVFRWFPLYLTRKLSRDYKIPIILATSAIFGYMHGGPWNVWVQGVIGLIMACVYIKNDYHYWSAVILHFLWNYMVTFGFHQLTN